MFKKFLKWLQAILMVVFMIVAIIGFILSGFWNHDIFNYPGLIAYVSYCLSISCFYWWIKC